MKVRIIGASTADCWYAECIGDVFQVFMYEGHTNPFFTNQLFFYAKDVEFDKTSQAAYVPALNHYGHT